MMCEHSFGFRSVQPATFLQENWQKGKVFGVDHQMIQKTIMCLNFYFHLCIALEYYSTTSSRLLFISLEMLNMLKTKKVKNVM